MPNKFGAKPITIDNIRFASGAEGDRYLELKLLLRGKQIEDLVCHPSWDLTVEGVFCGKFTPDFRYFETLPGKPRQFVAEEVKSKITAKGEAYRLRLKVWQALYPGIVFREVIR